MKLAVLNYCGTVGKTTLCTHLLAPRIKEAHLFAIETINETAADLGLEVEKVKGERFGHLYKQLAMRDNAIVDVGASNIEDFFDRMVKYEESHTEFDYFVIPVTRGTKEQKESLKTIEALSRIGVPAERIRVVFNRVDNDVEEEFGPILGAAKKLKTFIANTAAAIFENELFDMLAVKKLSLPAVLADPTDYKALLKNGDPKTDPKKLAHYADMMAIKALAKGVHRNFDQVYHALFA